MSINIDLGVWNSIFAVPSKVVDEGLKFSDGVKLKVLLFVLRNAGSSFDESEISGGHHEHHHDHGHHHHHHHHHDHDHDDEETFDFDGEIVLADPLGIDTRLYEIIKDRVSQNL